MTLLTVGTCSITASQPGNNSTYSWAVPVTQTFTISILTPTVTSVTPNTAPAFSQSTTITIAGTNFGGASLVSFTPVGGGTPVTIAPTTIQATQIVANVPALQLTTVGTAEIAVVNGGTVSSNLLPFTITSVASTTVSLVSSANPLTFGHSVTLTASVSPSAATGKVTFYDGTTCSEPAR